MKKGLKMIAAMLSAVTLLSTASVTAYADKVKTVDGLKYRYSDSGELKGLMTGWVKAKGGARYYYKNGEPLRNKWLKVKGVRTYYVDSTGCMVTGKQEIKGKTYLFGENGRLIDDGGDEWHIKGEITELTTGYANVCFTQYLNETGAEYTLSPSYRLEKLVDGEWQDYEKELFDEMDWDDYLTEFDPESGNVARDTLRFPKTLEQGTYRARMSVGCHGGDKSDYRRYYLEFDIKNNTPNTLGISMNPTDVTKTGMTLEITQKGGRVYGELTGGLEYTIEKKKTDGTWEELKYAHDDVGFDDLGILINPDKEDDYKYEMEVDWEYVYGSLKKGKYRISKSFFDFIQPGPQNQIKAYGYFTIK